MFAPAGDVVVRALKTVRRGGLVIVAGIYSTPIPEMDYREHLYYERVLRSVSNYTKGDAVAFLSIAAEVPVKVRVTTFRFEEAGEALLAVKRGEVAGSAVIII